MGTIVFRYHRAIPLIGSRGARTVIMVCPHMGHLGLNVLNVK